MTEQPLAAGDGEAASPPPTDPPDLASPRAADPEDWQWSSSSGDDERYLRERPPHWE